MSKAIHADAELAIRIMYAVPMLAGRKPMPADELAMLLLVNSVERVTTTFIAEEFGMPMATACDLVARCIEAGRVEKKRNQFNHKEYHVSITPQGIQDLRRSRRCTE